MNDPAQEHDQPTAPAWRADTHRRPLRYWLIGQVLAGWGPTARAATLLAIVIIGVGTVLGIALGHGAAVTLLALLGPLLLRAHRQNTRPSERTNRTESEE